MRKSYNTPEIDIYEYTEVINTGNGILSNTDNGGDVPDVPMPFAEN